MTTTTAEALAPTPEESLWTVTEAAAYLRASKRWVYDATAAGRLPHLRILGLLRFDPEKIREFATRACEARPGKVLPIK